MSDWRPSAGPETARRRATILARIREYFAAAEVLEVDTPALSPYAVSDTQIDSFEIGRSLLSQRPLYLHTSPEFCMKRLLADGYPDIYSVCRVFRDGESGREHQPEFTMIEWYRLGFGLDSIVDDTLRLLSAALGRKSLWNDAVHYDYRDLFLETVGLDPLLASVEELALAGATDARLSDAIGNERDDWLDLILSTRIVPTFPPERVTVLRHYPASQAALARLCPDDRDVADRFEVFIGRAELANGYVELTDAVEQAKRLGQDIERRQRRKRPARPLDETLLAALQAGLPPCAGVALGLERLQMIHDGTDDMRNVVTFAFEPGT